MTDSVRLPDGAQQITDEGQVKKASRRFDTRDFNAIAEIIKQLHAERKGRRSHLEKQWKEIDRQLRMEPDLSARIDPQTSKIRQGAEWMPAVELPLQAQTLETLTADTRRMLFPDAGSFFEAHVALTDKYLKRVDFQSLVAGDENDVPSKMNQDNADKLVEGWLDHHHRQYDFRGHWDAMNAEAFKYGTLLGRARLCAKSVFIDTAKGMVKREQKFPVLFPTSIKNVYLDDTKHHLMHEGVMVGPSVIKCDYRLFQDVLMAAQKGSSNPDDPEGGWMPSQLKGVEPDDGGYVEVLEYEGDLIVPRKTVRSLFLPGVTVTVVCGKAVARTVRIRFNKFPFSSYLTQPYHVEDASSPYGVGPLMKGMPIQKAATEAMNRLMAWAILNVEPPIKYDRNDPFFVATGGPDVYPRALWQSLGEVEPVKIGDGGALTQLYLALLSQYYDVTGVNAPRLGAQTLSHTTAFAKNAELNRGVVRTVDYVNSVRDAPLTRWLHMSYEMGKAAMKGTETFWIPAYGGFVTIAKDHLPDQVEFEVFGAGGPSEEAEKLQKRLQALQLAAQMEPIKLQTGGTPMDWTNAQKQILREGGWTDVDFFFPAPAGGAAAAAPAGAGVPSALITSSPAGPSLLAAG